MSDSGIEAVAKIAERDGVNWSEAVRRLLAYAVPRMPPGWPPRSSKDGTQ